MKLEKGQFIGSNHILQTKTQKDNSKNQSHVAFATLRDNVKFNRVWLLI